MAKKYYVEKNELIKIVSENLRLIALKAAGVDNWQSYGENFEDFLKENEAESFEDLATRIVEGYGVEIEDEG